ncbi:MAG: FkbM family methyltransferase [Algoriphagus sp.]|jgi:FkbM family methyltransferase|uniref:FkbM family methyltransferase n=1 Tax=Algoriphagus sp. TaxID=1872435 RepID=UPI00262C5BBD|nr:FkbM family methyltransferase [Algoriphagus sp.]MDG1278179.1 FkbM family methyltransferase [Algoriphagus sp.]
MKKIWKELNIVKDIFALTFASPYTFWEKCSLLKVQLISYLALKFKVKNKIATTSLMGMKVSFYGHFNLLYLIKEIFLLGEYKIQSSDEFPVIIDCGANIGLSVLYFKKIHPGCKILAFEPNPDVYALLKKNVAQNKLENVEIYNLCLSSSEGDIEFHLDENFGSMQGSVLLGRGGTRKIKVKSVQLSSFIEGNIDLVKMDIEGAELVVIDELIRSGKVNFVQNFLIEYHHNIPGQKTGLGAFISQFENHGFRLNLRSRFNDQGEFQDVFLNLYQ